MSFHILNQYSNKDKVSKKRKSNKHKNTKASKSNSRLLPRAPLQGNFNINYNTFDIKIPNFTFCKAIELTGAGGLIAVSVGRRKTDNQIVLAKISPHNIRLEREYYISKKLYSLPDGPNYIPKAIEYVSLAQDGLAALIYTDIQPDDCIYFEYQHKANYQTLYFLTKLMGNHDIWNNAHSSMISGFHQISLESFLGFSIECSSALQFLHENGIIHGELRPSAFLCRRNSTCISAKLWNFGEGLNSYEELLLTTSRWRSFMSHDQSPSKPGHRRNYSDDFRIVSNSSRFYSPKEFQSSLVYVSPEQTGRTSNALDHRADLYSLGIMFFVILTGQDPFKGSAMDIIHAILSKNVPLVHTIRSDVPSIISLIIDKLTRKTVDERYGSVYGLREDLLECQQRLANPDSEEVFGYFQLGLRDINPLFKVADGIYGRYKEIEQISSIIENSYNIHQKEMKRLQMLQDPARASPKPGNSKQSIVKEADNLLRANSTTSLEHTNCEVIVLKGPGGIGKSTLVSALTVQARHCGYTATAKFDKNQKRPYNGLLRCLSSILRQLLTESEHVIREFYSDLKYNLGPQFSNVKLLVSMVPELKPILYGYQEKSKLPDDDSLANILNTESRFHSVFLNIIRTIARKKLVTLCLDDLQEADEASLHLISALIYSKTTMLVILTYRDGDEAPRAIEDMLERCVEPVTMIYLRPLGIEIVKELILNTLYGGNPSYTTIQYFDKESQEQERMKTIEPLVETIYAWTRGNPFYIKQFLKTMKRKEDIWFDWTAKHWKFRLNNIRQTFDNAKPTPTSNLKRLNASMDLLHLSSNHTNKPSNSHSHHNDHLFDVRNLVSHLKSLDLNAQYFLMWASLFGHVFNFRRVRWLMMTTSSGAEVSDEESSTTSSNSYTQNSFSQRSMTASITSEDNENTKSYQNHTSPTLSATLSASMQILSMEEEEKRSNQAMLGLQNSLNEGVIQYKVGNEFYFIHDRYYQAASMLIVDPFQKERMHLKIGQMLMMEEGMEEDDNVFLIADHLVQCIGLIRILDKRKPYRDILTRAGDEACSSGALQVAEVYFKCALLLLDEEIHKRWEDSGDNSYRETLNIYMKVLELKLSRKKENDNEQQKSVFNSEDFVSWKNAITNGKLVTKGNVLEDSEEIDSLLSHMMTYTKRCPCERAQAWRIQARICFQQSNYTKGIHNILEGLCELGIVVNTGITVEEVIEYYQSLKPKIMERGFDQLLEIGLCKDYKQIAIMLLLHEACTGAYWVNPILVEFFSLKLCELSMEYGYTSASGSGFIGAGYTATRVLEFGLAGELGKFGLVLTEKYSRNREIARAIMAHYSMLATWTGVHVAEYIQQYQRAYKFAVAGGDKLFSSMALFHVVCTLYWTNCNLSQIHWHMNHSLEECRKSNSKDILILNISIWRSILAFQGKTNIKDPETLMNDPEYGFDERTFFDEVKSHSTDSTNPLNWYYSNKVLLLTHFGFYKEAAELGFRMLESTINAYIHRHLALGIYYHTLALIEALRDPQLDPETREKYYNQVLLHERKLSDFAQYSAVNYRLYYTIIRAQISTLDPTQMATTLRLYNEVIELALKGNWYTVLAVIFELATAHYMRCGLSMLGVPTLLRSIEFYSRWGAVGKVKYLKELYAKELSLQNVAESQDMGVQTEDDVVSLSATMYDKSSGTWDNNSSFDIRSDTSLKESLVDDDPQNLATDSNCSNIDASSNIMADEVAVMKEEALFSLDMVDLTSIIKSTQVISNEMNSFDDLLKKMMGIIMANSGAESGAIIIKEEFFGIAAYSARATDVCETYEPPLMLSDDEQRISTSIVHYVIHTNANLFISNIENDARFATGDTPVKKGAVICMPIMHKNTMVGVLYLQANLNAFTRKHANVLALLCDQIGISITNALLFKSVQKATKANAFMIESQLKALEEARASKEQALHATKMKSNFLANMSHELRTPFSGFYGMISLLSETRLDAEQREFVSIAKQSCEMLLHIIDDLLDFSKLEAQKVKLLHGLFYIEDLIADRIELLITLATNKNVEMSYFIDEDVPTILYGDGNRIGQILMNLIGNAIKFTHHGEVIVRCGVDKSEKQVDSNNIKLRISVQDTGIGMSEEEIKGLFLPFSQVDGSTTRNFGGTGLGLSICLQLVKLMNGAIEVDSVVNEGSTFTFTIIVKNGDSVRDSESGFDLQCSTIHELKSQINQPHILVISPERIFSMIKSMLPWAQNLEHRTTIEDSVQLALTRTNDGGAFDCLIIDLPQSDALLKLINSIENNPVLENTQILLLISPTVENIRKHLTNNNTSSYENNELLDNDQLYNQSAFHPLVTRLSKPLRTIKLLNALIKILSKPVERHRPTKSMSIEDLTSLDVSTPDITTDNNYHSPTLAQPVESDPVLLVSAPYSRKHQETFSPEELAIFKGQRILIAEDNHIAQRLIVKQLSRLGFAVDKCNNGFECFDTWKLRGPGYFLLAWIDHHMPGCDGLEATRKIRQHEKENNITPPLPIIALTADIQSTAQANCLNAGMNDYVTKPLMQKDLARILRKYCLGRTTL